jgi:uncharacterized membrane protein YheB (UPF0754 family)
VPSGVLHVMAEAVDGMVPFANAGQIVLTALIPIIAGIVGYYTNVAAILMTFYPIKYVGVRPCGRELPGVCGWQGIIPQKAEPMARRSVEIISRDLIKVTEVFAKLDPEEFAEVAERALWRTTASTLSRVLTEVVGPSVRDAIPPDARKEMVDSTMDTSRRITVTLLRKMKSRISKIFDLEATVVRVLTREPILLVRTFQQCGEAEFRFIERSGLYFGFLFGVIQMVVWLYFRQWWLLPLFGLLVGWATNFVAIKVIFNPVRPVETICGFDVCCGRPVKRLCCGRPIQGLFLQRQEEVSIMFADITANTVMTSRHIIEDLQLGDGGRVLYQLVQRGVAEEHGKVLSGVLGAVSTLVVGEDSMRRVNEIIVEEVFDAVPAMLLEEEEYTTRVFDIQNTLEARLRALPPEKFEQVLHPVFEEDEWKLILVGAVLGMLVGFLQAGADYLASN